MQNRPAAELEINEATVTGVLAEQRPDLVHLDVERAGEGWDNATFRLGRDLAVRMPRREAAVSLITNEQRWLPELAPQLPIPVPAPLFAGRPSEAFPWPWSLITWVEGDVAAPSGLDEPIADADRMGRFLTALHQPAPGDAPDNPYRGQDVRTLEDRLVRNLAMLSADDLDGWSGDEILSRWRDAAAADAHAERPTWIHGDLHGLNVLVDQGRIAAVIDFGDMASGDPAVDLPIGWMLFDTTARNRFRAVCGADEDQWARGWAWALHFSILYLANSADHPALRQQGEHLLAALRGDPSV